MGTPRRLGKAKFKSRVHAVQRTDKHECGNAPDSVNQPATKSALRLRCPAKMSLRFRLLNPGCNDTTQPAFFFASLIKIKAPSRSRTIIAMVAAMAEPN